MVIVVVSMWADRLLQNMSYTSIFLKERNGINITYLTFDRNNLADNLHV